MRFKAHPRVLAGIEEEGCLLHGRVDVIIVGELRQGECVPVVLSFFNEDPQVLFQFLVDPFRLSIASGKGLLYLGYTWVDLVLSRLSKLSRASQDASKAVKAI